MGFTRPRIGSSRTRLARKRIRTWGWWGHHQGTGSGSLDPIEWVTYSAGDGDDRRAVLAFRRANQLSGGTGPPEGGPA